MNRRLIKHTVDESLDPVVLLPALETDEVHATFPAVVPGIEPIPLCVPKIGIYFKIKTLVNMN